MPQRRQPPTGANQLPQPDSVIDAASAQFAGQPSAPDNLAAASRLEEPERPARKLPDYRTRDNIEQ